MIDRLKTQREKLIINERHEAWGNLARKLAHEIKNPLTPIQLTIDRIKNKYLDQLSSNDQENFRENLKIINNQIKQIENLVNEFSDFARMPKPILKNKNKKRAGGRPRAATAAPRWAQTSGGPLQKTLQ